MSSESDFLQSRQFSKEIKASGGNFNVYTRSGKFEARGIDAEATAKQILNTRTICFGPYTIAPNCIDVIERVEVGAKKVSAGDTSGVRSKSSKGSSGDSEAK